MIKFNEFAEDIINKRISLMNEYASHVNHIYKISKIFILTDFIINIQKEALKNKSNLFMYIDNEKLSKNYEKSFLLCNLSKFSKNSNSEIFISHPYKLLFNNYFVISDMMSTLTFKQRKHFLRLHSYMCSCHNYNKSILRTFKEHSYKEYTNNLRNGVNVLIAYDSYITNEDISNCISFSAYSIGLKDDSKIKTWNDLYDYCKENCFGFVLNTYEQYVNLLNSNKSSFYNVSNIIEDVFLSFEHFEIILSELSKL